MGRDSLYSKRVACVVVTYNRLGLLKNCVLSLRNQTNKDFDIIIVNNGSSDGTKEWLDTQSDLLVINQDNLGGAGGFYAGMKRAFDDGYEWVWLMDDDGEADKYQLEKLLAGSEYTKSLFVNAIVCNINDRDKLAFGLVHQGNLFQTLVQCQKYEAIPDSINPFNGTFINRKVIERIGFIKKEMFIWGDEREYTLRAQKNGYKIYTITNALHYHPCAKSSCSNVIPFCNRYKVVIPENVERQKIRFRNDGFVFETYFPQRDRLVVKTLHSLYFIFRLNVIGLIRYHKYYRRGAKNLFETKTLS